MDGENSSRLVPTWVILGVGALVIVYLALAVVDKGYGLSRRFVNEKPENTISISAEGRVSASPDTATVGLGVLVQSSSAESAQTQATEKTNQIVDFVKKQGIADEDITTSNFNIYPRYNYDGGTNRIIGYEANQTVTVKIKGINNNAAQVGKILEGATTNGANQIQGVSFGFDDPDDLRQLARKEAIAKAKEKAQELADEAGISLGKVVSISESGGSFPPPMPYYDESFARGQASDVKNVAPTIQPGSQEIVQNITVIFEVK
ncbi:MAG TPA: SIMPL domain-containing protein [Verrucomicrobiae bacterium]|nr:SIMPL domain-containing protein [Verrucomicrobiae bacterium]